MPTMSTAPEPQIQYVTLSMTHSSVDDQSANNPNRDLLNKPKSELTYVHPLHLIYPPPFLCGLPHYE